MSSEMPFICHIDIETFSKTLLKKAGVYRYAECSSTEILCLAFAFGDEPVNFWIPDPLLPTSLKRQIRSYVSDQGGLCHIGFKLPKRIFWHATKGGQFRAHNSQFERTILNGLPGRTIRFPKTKRSQWVCTAAKAAAHSLPRDLGSACKAVKTEHQKDENGKPDMLRLSKPRKPSKHNPATRWLPDDVPEKFYNLYTYCIDDVLAERDLDHAVPDLGKSEQKLFLLDQKINDRGWRVDLERIADVQFLITDYKARLANKMRELTGLNPTQTQKLSEWFRDQGVDIENLQAQTVKDTLKRKDLAQEVRWVLRIYSLHNMKAPDKFTAMQRSVCADGRLRGMFLFCGASTGRWSSLIVQLQNLFRPIIEDPELAIEAFRERSVSWIKMLWPQNPMKIFASCVRGMLIPGEGRDLLFADFKSIEARIVAWLAGQLDMIEIFATHGLAYEYTAAKMFGHPTDIDYLKAFEKNFPKLRFLGKIAVLALGYQGGGAAFVKMAKQHGTDVDFEQGETIKWDWRDANPQIVEMWDDVQTAAIAAVERPGTTFKANKLMFRVVGDYLYMRLPSKRKLAYFKPKIRRGELTYMGIHTYTRQWVRCTTYGGKLVQNAAEGIARDLMALAMFELNKRKYPILGTVHDEIITEPREGFGSVKEVCTVMCDKPDWAKGLPVGAVGFRGKRYRK
jgi:DNA polymerase